MTGTTCGTYDKNGVLAFFAHESCEGDIRAGDIVESGNQTWRMLWKF